MLNVQAQIVRIYAEAIRKACGPLLKKDDHAAELVRLLLSLADATADCAEQMCATQLELEILARELGLRPPRPRLMVIKGGAS